jgi:hypothetical protein
MMIKKKIIYSFFKRKRDEMVNKITPAENPSCELKEQKYYY